jgi:arylsulfatase A-like enzyme
MNLSGKTLLGMAALFTTATSNAFSQQKNAKPNIVIIYADDLGYGDVQCNNPERGKIPTPNIDKLAAQGISFTDAHSSSAVCSPSRYSLLTGRYHWRSRLQKGIVGLFEKPLITPDRLTIAGLVKQEGYQTACIGKWHLGWDWSIDKEKRQLWDVNKAKEGQDDEVYFATEEQKKAWQNVYSKPIKVRRLSQMVAAHLERFRKMMFRLVAFRNENIS